MITSKGIHSYCSFMIEAKTKLKEENSLLHMLWLKSSEIIWEYYDGVMKQHLLNSITTYFTWIFLQANGKLPQNFLTYFYESLIHWQAHPPNQNQLSNRKHSWKFKWINIEIHESIIQGCEKKTPKSCFCILCKYSQTFDSQLCLFCTQLHQMPWICTHN